MENWKSLDIKQKFALGTAVVAFAVGWGLTVYGFFIPPEGEVSDSVLWVLGQAMVYTASVLGIGMYFKNQMVKFRADTKRYIDEELKEEHDEHKD